VKAGMEMAFQNKTDVPDQYKNPGQITTTYEKEIIMMNGHEFVLACIAAESDSYRVLMYWK
jgi:hypothetical protein